MVPNEYFRMEERQRQLKTVQTGQQPCDPLPSSQGTVGAVALDGQGSLAAAASTDAIRTSVLDSRIIGTGPYGKTGVCAISAIGYFIRAVAAPHICNPGEYRRLTRERAAQEMLLGIIGKVGGTAGLTAVNKGGDIVMNFSTQGVFRGARPRRETAIF
jgi:beta-aspartyl-peptidase (threonine type)